MTEWKLGHKQKEHHGVLYVAFGRPYLAMAIASCKTLKSHNPDLATAVVTNVCPKPRAPLTDYWSYVETRTEFNRDFKTRPHAYSPFDRTVMLDCDTCVVGRLDGLFEYLDDFDIAMRLMGLRIGHKYAGVEVLKGRKVGDLPHWNSGMLAFRRNRRTNQFFDLWHKNFKALGLPSDQPALVETVFKSRVRQLSVDHRWNCPAETYQRMKAGSDTIRVVHYTSGYLTPDIVDDIQVADRLLVEHCGLSVTDETDRHVNEGLRRRAKQGKSLPDAPLVGKS